MNMLKARTSKPETSLTRPEARLTKVLGSLNLLA